MLDTVRVAAIGLCSTTDVTQNQQVIAQQLQLAADQGVQLAVLPENALSFAGANPNSIATQFDSLAEWLAQQASDHGLWLVAGSVPCPSRLNGCAVPQARVRATSLIFDHQGKQRGRYDKIHLFDVEVADGVGRYQESLIYEPGEQLTLVETPFGYVGIAICYDLRFPEQFIAMRQQGADLICVPAAFTVPTGRAHWQLLLQARAIDSQCAVIGAAQGGSHGDGASNRQTWGHSMVVDSWGQILCIDELVRSTAYTVMTDIDLAQQRQRRQQMPLYTARPNLFLH